MKGKPCLLRPSFTMMDIPRTQAADMLCSPATAPAAAAPAAAVFAVAESELPLSPGLSRISLSLYRKAPWQHENASLQYSETMLFFGHLSRLCAGVKTAE